MNYFVLIDDLQRVSVTCVSVTMPETSLEFPGPNSLPSFKSPLTLQRQGRLETEQTVAKCLV